MRRRAMFVLEYLQESVLAVQSAQIRTVQPHSSSIVTGET